MHCTDAHTRRRPLSTRSRPLALAGVLALALAALSAAPAGAAIKTHVERVGPITVSGYEVQQSFRLAPKPPEDGHIIAMDVDIVDADGTPVPINRLMLHHIVFLNLSREDQTCKDEDFVSWDNRTSFGYAPERFAGAGEERARLVLPPGYGYPLDSDHRWAFAYMVMNHRAQTDTAYVQYRFTYKTGADDSGTRDVTPYWLDVRNCQADPIYNVPGTAGPRSTDVESSTYAMPEAGRIVAAGGHVHGGARRLELREPGCQDRLIGRSVPTWGMPDHPFYNVRPVLHEPGPVSMSGFLTGTGIPVASGERIRLDSLYDNSRPHTRVMGIFVMYVAHDPGVTQPCGALPGDVVYGGNGQTGRQGVVPFQIPLTGLDANGNAMTISRPPGPDVRVRGGATISVGDRFFSKPNVVIDRGQRLRWRFGGIELHNLTLANGPVGIASPNLDRERVFSRRFGRAGTYRFFCALHPVQMHQRVVVKRQR